jgi:enoyl-CoA hydratase/carnithine racemase
MRRDGRRERMMPGRPGRRVGETLGMDLKVIRYEVDDRVATITLHRPERLNAWTGRMHTEYRWALQQAQDDAEVRVVVVTGAGRGFCAGADAGALERHAERGSYDAGTPDDIARPGYGVDAPLDHDFAFHFALRTPVVAAINGPAAGVGLVLACYADVRFAVAGAKLTTAHGRLNLPAEYGLSWLLPRIVGLGRANDLLLTSRVVLAEEAFALGLVNAVLPDQAALQAHARDYARSLAHDVAPGSLAATKRQVALDLHRDLGQSVTDAGARLDAMMGEPAFAEGVAALTEKRAPRF